MGGASRRTVRRSPAKSARATCAGLLADTPHLLSTRPLFGLDKDELYDLTLLERAVSFHDDVGVVYKDVSPFLRLDEAVALRVVEPLYNAAFYFSHAAFPLRHSKRDDNNATIRPWACFAQNGSSGNTPIPLRSAKTRGKRGPLPNNDKICFHKTAPPTTRLGSDYVMLGEGSFASILSTSRSFVKPCYQELAGLFVYPTTSEESEATVRAIGP